MSGEISVKNSVEYLSETHAKLDIAVSAAEFQPAYQKAAKQLAKKVNIQDSALEKHRCAY